LTAGQHDIQVEYYDDTDDGVAKFYWLPPGESYFAVVPSDKLYHLVGAAYVAGGLDAEYFDNADFTASVLTRVDSTIDFYWGTGDNGPGGVEFAPEVYVGRIPVYNDDYVTLDAILQKIITYETAVVPAWRHSLLTANVYLWPDQSDYLLGEALKADFADPLGFSSYRIYESDFGIVPPPECPTINAASADPAADCNMLGEWANGGGYGLVTWSTHGGQSSASQLIISADNSHLDDTTPAFVFQGSCLNGYPENTNNLGYSLLAQGAIGTISASRVSWNYCFNPALDPNPLAGNNSNLTYHYAMRIMQDRSAGHALYLTKSNVNPSDSWMNKMDYNLYGDPSVALFRSYGGLALLFDTSGSMSWSHEGTPGVPVAEQRLSLAKEATYPFMELLNDHADRRVNFGISVFPPHPWSAAVGCNGQIVTPMTLTTEANKDTAVTTTIPNLVAEGNTPLLAGLTATAGMFGTETPRAIVLLSDGYHNCPTIVDSTDPEVTTLIDQLNTDAITVYTIGFGRPSDIDHLLLQRLAEDTGGQFYDVTTAAFDPAAWSPATDLQATYKAILVDTLGLETAADPLGVIDAGARVIQEVKINEHDRRISIFLSWETPAKDRLGLSVKSSDGREIKITGPGVSFHQGETYKILTVDRTFLRQPGKVGPTPWIIEIDAGGLDEGEREHYQYSVILDSGLKMETAFDQDTYRVGDTLTLSAKITAGGRPVTGLTDISVQVTRPEEGAGNWFAAHKVSTDELQEIPEKRGGETLSPLLRKAQYLTDIRKLAFPARTEPAALRLYDDGTHGDPVAKDGIYTNRFADTVKEGTYSFHLRVSGKTDKGAFERDDVIQKYLTPRVSPKYTLVHVASVLIDDAKLKQFKIAITPRDAFENYLGPRYAGAIKLSATQGKFIGTVQDNLDGSYSQVLELPATVDIKQVDIKGQIQDAEFSFNLAEKLEESGAIEESVEKLEENGKIDRRVYWLIIIALLILVALLLIRLIRRKKK